MKARDLVKKALPIEEIYNGIKQDNEHGMYKHLVPHFIYVKDEDKLTLMADGFKVYEGEFDSGRSGLIIEW